MTLFGQVSRTMPLSRVAQVSDPGLHDGSGLEPKEDGEAADRGELQRQSEVECLIPREECAGWGEREAGGC